MKQTFLLLLAVLTPGEVWAAEEATTPAPMESPTLRKSRRSVKPAMRDADGSAAPNRFEAETVIKSTYTLDGKTLEVDPD